MATVEQIIGRAGQDVGFTEGPNNDTPFGRWYGVPNQPYCFVAGTLVDTPRRAEPIESLTVGDRVLSTTGRSRRISRVGERVAPTTLRLRAHGLDETVTTPEHPYWARRRLNQGRQQPRRVGPPEWIKAGELRPGDYIGSPVPLEYGCLEVEDELAYLIGRWIGDGSICAPPSGGGGARVVISCAHEEAEGLAKAIGRAGFTFHARAGRTCTHLELYRTKELARRLEPFGRLAHGKHLANEVFMWPRQARQALLDGYVDADGHRDARGRVTTTTVSRPLAIGVAKLVRSLGMAPAVASVKRRSRTAVIQGRLVHQRDVWTVSWSPDAGSSHAFFEADFCWAPVRSVTMDGPAKVHNLEVEDEHTFVADGAAVHNCAMWLSFVFFECGAPQPASSSKGYAYTPAGAAWFQKQGRWGQTPQPGAHVFFRFGGPRIHHVGLVVGVGPGYIDTIEANTSQGSGGSQRDGGGVWRRRRSAGIVGYGYPVLEGGPTPPSPQAQVGAAPPWPGRLIRQPPVMQGDDVRTWQAQMAARGWKITADGAYGPASADICRKFQAEKGLEVDGVIGQQTWATTWNAPLT